MSIAVAQPDSGPDGSHQPAKASKPAKGILTPTDVRLGPWKKDPVNVRLRGIRWRQRFFNLLTLLLGVLSAMLIYVVVMMCADRIGEFETSTRQIFLGTAAIMLGITAILMSLYFLFGKFNPMLHAREIDRALGLDDDSLVTYIDLRRRKNVRAADVDIAELLQNIALERVQRIDADQVIDAKPLARTLKVLGGTAALILLLFLFWGRTFSDSFHRVMMPWKLIAPPRWTQIVDIIPGSSTAVAGEPVRFSGVVRTNGIPDGVTLRYKVDGEVRGASEPLSRVRTDASGVQFSKELPGFPRAVTYWLESGDAKAGPFRLDITARPLIASVNVKVHPPAYAQFAPVREAAGGHVQAVAGSRLEITATATHPVKLAPANGESLSAWLDVGGKKTPMFIDGSTLITNVLLTRDFEYRIGFIDTRNLSSRDGVQYQAKVIPDAPPAAALSRDDAADGTPAPHNGRISLRAEASDDLGLAKIVLRLNILGGLDGSPLRSIEHAPLRPPRDFKHVFEVNLEELRLRDGDALDCVLYVEDVLKPKAQSFATPPVRIPIVRGEQRTRQLGSEIEAIAGILDRSLTRPDSKPATAPLSSDAQLSAEEERLLQELAELIKARQDATNKEQRELTAKELEKFADELAKLAEEATETADAASKDASNNISASKNSKSGEQGNSSDKNSGDKADSKGGESGNKANDAGKGDSGKSDAGSSGNPGANKGGSEGGNKAESGNAGAGNGSGNREGNGSGNNPSGSGAGKDGKGGSGQSAGKSGGQGSGKSGEGSGNGAGTSGGDPSNGQGAGQGGGAPANAGGTASGQSGGGASSRNPGSGPPSPGGAHGAKQDVNQAAQDLRDGKADDKTLEKTKAAFDHLFKNGRGLNSADREKLRAAAESLKDEPGARKLSDRPNRENTQPKGRARSELSGGSTAKSLTTRSGDMKEDELGRTIERGAAKIAPEYRKALEEYYKSLNK